MDRNKAEIITEEQKRVIDGYMLDVLNILPDSSGFLIDADYTCGDQGKVTMGFSWRKHGFRQTAVFNRQPYCKTEEDFFNEIKAYLFSLLATLTNLRKEGNTCSM